ncbi:MAG TPA: AtpZ/AtpI family protein [Patescibacteria group bacterium]|nr:AtpZ/AtpI family protein [Patescibacteria group bacterium]
MSESYDVILEDVDGNIRPRKPKPPEKNNKRGSSGWEYVSYAGAIGFDIALPMALGLIAGVKLDSWWGTSPKATLALFIAGVVISCTSLIRIVRDASRGA